MKKNTSNRFFSVILLIAFALVVPINAQKMSAEDIVAKHLASIAPDNIRAEIKNQLVFYNVEFKQKGSTAIVNGKGLILSEGNKSLWGMTLSSNDYPQDQFSFNGSETNVAFTRPGARSIIGDFIRSYDEIMKNGLLGGTLSTSWALANRETKKARLSYDGTKNINGREAYVLSYSPKGSSDLDVKMYFDQQNFQHLRTEYSRVIAARQGVSIDGSAGQTPDRYRLIEDFSDFTKMGNLTLPSTYKLFYSYSRIATIREAEWNFKVTNYSFNQKLESNSFEINQNTK